MSSPSRSLTVLLGIVATILMGWVLYVGAGILQPLVIALLLTNILQPVVRRLGRWHIPPPVTVVLLTVLLFFGLAQAGIFLRDRLQSFLDPSKAAQTELEVDQGPGQAPATPPELGAGAAAPPAGEAGGQEPEEGERHVVGGWPGIIEGIIARLDEQERTPDAIKEVFRNVLTQVNGQQLAGTLIGSGIGFTRGLVLVMIYMIFIFAEQAVFKRKILSIAGRKREEAAQILDTMAIGIQRYLGVKTLVSLMTGGLAYLTLQFLGIDYAILFGLLTFLLNYIPTFGSIIAGIFPTFTALAAGDPWSSVVIIIIAYLTINFVLGTFLEPKVLGRELNLSPLVIVISVVFWGSLWGVVGAFLAVPLTASAQIILASQVRTRAIAVMLSSRPPPDDRAVQ
ncbi:MAG: AI-2E family transporter [Planctomycetes bacterium]|nr:AI-2E family transporter [Planctomycetota bacterium]MBL7007548.1 AI-2E family transporter [Planctomycetota bacterium]